METRQRWDFGQGRLCEVRHRGCTSSASIIHCWAATTSTVQQDVEDGDVGAHCTLQALASFETLTKMATFLCCACCFTTSPKL
eukprot:6055027-Amphidinium_carterae.1